MIKGSLLGYKLGTTDGIALDSNEGIVIGTSDVEVLGISLWTIDGSILGIDEGNYLGPVVSPSGGLNDGKPTGSLLWELFVNVMVLYLVIVTLLLKEVHMTFLMCHNW